MDKEGSEAVKIRAMEIVDYQKVYHLWTQIEGFGLRTIDDSKEGITRFLMRNPHTSVVAEEDGKIIGSILCGHDGRTGCFYHVCVEKNHRNRGIATKMTSFAMEALRKEHINKVSLVAFRQNETGNACWHELGWEEREDLNCYDYILNSDNVVIFNKDKR
ncbi:MAG: GNAT family N-acetyltransferase [Lachnospiraceae bacterium]|nr:GNAT family N-acetyltransferase [Lachnospiraceae bacterium]